MKAVYLNVWDAAHFALLYFTFILNIFLVDLVFSYILQSFKYCFQVVEFLNMKISQICVLRVLYEFF